MEGFFEQLPAWITTLLAPSLAISAVCWKGDEALSKEAKDTLAKRIASADPASLRTVAIPLLSSLLEVVYGENHFSTKCVLRVFVGCIITATIVFLCVALIQEKHLSWTSILYPLWSPVLSTNFLATTVFINFTTDFFSILKSRFVIYKISDRPSFLNGAFWIIFDIVSTIIIFSVIFQMMLILIPNILILPYWTLLQPGDYYNYYFGDGILLLETIFLTSFVTVGWVLIFIIANSIFAISLRVQPILDFLRWALPIQDQPVRSIGIAAGITVFVALALGKGMSTVLLRWSVRDN